MKKDSKKINDFDMLSKQDFVLSQAKVKQFYLKHQLALEI